MAHILLCKSSSDVGSAQDKSLLFHDYGHSRETTEIYLEHFLRHWSFCKEVYEPFLQKLVEIFSSKNAIYGGFSWYKSNNNARLETIAGEKEPYNPKIKIPSAVLWGKHDPILRPQNGIMFTPKNC